VVIHEAKGSCQPPAERIDSPEADCQEIVSPII